MRSWLKRRPASDVTRGALVRVRGAKHRRVIEKAADDLNREREAGFGKSRGHGDRRMSREVEWCTRLAWVRSPDAFIVVDAAGGVHRIGCEQNVDVGEDVLHGRDDFAPTTL